jgi:hypothetical protein
MIGMKLCTRLAPGAAATSTRSALCCCGGSQGAAFLPHAAPKLVQWCKASTLMRGIAVWSSGSAASDPTQSCSARRVLINPVHRTPCCRKPRVLCPVPASCARIHVGVRCGGCLSAPVASRERRTCDPYSRFPVRRCDDFDGSPSRSGT